MTHLCGFRIPTSINGNFDLLMNAKEGCQAELLDDTFNLFLKYITLLAVTIPTGVIGCN